MAALTTEEVLREEAKAIHGKDLSNKTGVELYQELNKLNSAALCLSGGGIRSAAFALGIIQALATHTTAPKPGDSVKAEHSFLARINYLSTVSGGGYIGSWLSTWVTRAGFPAVWSNLVGRPKGPNIEPPVIAWLRSYSNFLTPKLGITSADTLAAIALISRNLALNWFVILPVLCVVLLVFKGYAFGVSWFSQFSPQSCGAMYYPAIAGGAAVLFALWFMHIQRPAHNDSTAGQRGVLLGNLAPAVLAGILFSLALAAQCAYTSLYELPAYSWTASSKALIGLGSGVAIYVLAWIVAFPFWRIWKPTRTALLTRRWREIGPAFPGRATWKDVRRDIFASVVAGAVYGLIIVLGAHVYIKYLWENGLWKFDRAEILLVVLSVPWALAAQLLAEMIFVGLTSHEKNSDADREWLARAAGAYILTALVWALLMFLIFLASTVATDLYEKVWAWATGIGAGGIAAWLAKSGLTPAKGPAKGGKAFSANILIAVAASLFAIVLIVMASAALDTVLFGDTLVKTVDFHGKVVKDGFPSWPGGWWLWIGLGVAMAMALIASYFININRFSLHALYRNRLIRAFLGASHVETRRPNPFTDFDDFDNLRIHELWSPEDMWEQTRQKGWQPFHVINIALNIVSTKRLAWQERKAETFTASPLHSGSPCGHLVVEADGSTLAHGAYRRSSEYGGEDGISVGTALAISGAAASPNMGYHSSPPLAFLMTMFNVRLGWWLGNPASENNKIYGGEGPQWAIVPLLNEMIGNTKDDSDYVYLSDGGHFENLGLYEMVRRRCKFIIVSDGGCDPDFAFEDLGNAVRKIALDLGVTITFRGISVLKSRAEEDRLSRCCKDEWEKRQIPDEDDRLYAIGTINYGAGQEGIVLYLKAAYHKAVVKNVGVRSYAIANPDFPHQSTGDQFFSESQFESYRALGFEIMEDVFARGAALLVDPSHPTLQGIISVLHDKAVEDVKP